MVNENLSFFILVNESGQTEGDNVVAAGHGREDTSRDVHGTCKSQSKSEVGRESVEISREQMYFAIWTNTF